MSMQCLTSDRKNISISEIKHREKKMRYQLVKLIYWQFFLICTCRKIQCSKKSYKKINIQLSENATAIDAILTNMTHTPTLKKISLVIVHIILHHAEYQQRGSIEYCKSLFDQACEKSRGINILFAFRWNEFKFIHSSIQPNQETKKVDKLLMETYTSISSSINHSTPEDCVSLNVKFIQRKPTLPQHVKCR